MLQIQTIPNVAHGALLVLSSQFTRKFDRKFTAEAEISTKLAAGRESSPKLCDGGETAAKTDRQRRQLFTGVGELVRKFTNVNQGRLGSILDVG